MSTSYLFALEYPGDWRPLRDYFYEACKCTHFWTGPMSSQQGPPDSTEREHYGVYNRYNLIDLDLAVPPSTTYRTNVHVSFANNKRDATGFMWSVEILDACVRWLARSTGDAFLDLNGGGGILGRIGDGPVVVDARWAEGGWSKDKQIIRVFLPVVLNALEREELEFVQRPLQAYYS